MEKRGYTLTEVIFYLAILAVVSVLVVNLLLTITRSFLLFRINRGLNHSAVVATERLLRETRQAASLDLGLSTFDVHPGRLVLTSTDAADNPRTIDFRVENKALMMSENGGATTTLTAAPAAVDKLIFHRLVTPRVEAVKIELTLRDQRGAAGRSDNFYTTAVLRGSY